MSEEGSIARVRWAGAAGMARVVAVLLVAGVVEARAAGTVILPVTPDCRSDLDGANDVPGELDLTRSCTRVAEAPFELQTATSLDKSRHDGAATILSCELYDTDSDVFANLALCAAVKRSSGAGNDLVLAGLRLFTCTDGAADRCSSATLVPGAYGTSCTVGQEKEDPFPGPAPGPGQHYPLDTLVRCSVDLDDFGVPGAAARPLDACSYSGEAPDSAPADCLVLRACASAADCDDGSPCTADSCDASGVCLRLPQAGASCDDGIWCNGEERCSALGLCGSSDGPVVCDDGVDCTLDSCDEIADACVSEPRNSVCSDGLYCNGVEVCDPKDDCRAGAAPDCRDGIDCTVDQCNEDADGCDHLAQDDACIGVLVQLGQRP